MRQLHWIPVAALLAALSAGCQTERVMTSDGRPLPPEPRAAPRAPEGVTPNRMLLLVSQRPEDTNGNGFPDNIRVETALFSHPHPTALEVDGTFVFQLFKMGESNRPDAEVVAEWRVPATADDRARAAYGLCYRFGLSLITDDAEGDLLPRMQGDLRGSFEPTAEGPPVSASAEVRMVNLGLRTGAR
jgi:hypothetical protein